MKLYCEKCETTFTAEAPASGKETECPECHSKIAYPESNAAPGVVIGDFRILKHLSKGGMGDVFLAHQISLDRPAALKVLQEKFINDKEYVDSLIREARAAAKLNHPNIVQAYAVGKEDGVFYFAMEFVQGKTFKEILQEQKVLDFEQAAKVIRQVADALDFAWKEQKLVHQDIKPDNIMLDSNGRAKLADLGLARSANTEFDADAEEVLGTPQYISPEQLTGVPTDVRSDIYSLGATFYQFVTGRFPYVSNSVEELAKMHVAGNLEPPKQVNPQLPDELNTIILKMMARKLDERYQSPKILIQALELFLNSRKKAGGVPTLTLKSKKEEPKPKLALKLPGKDTAEKTPPKAASPAAPAAAKPVLKATPPAAPAAAKPVLKATPPAAPAVAKPVQKATPPAPPAAAKSETPAAPPVPPAPAAKAAEAEKKPEPSAVPEPPAEETPAAQDAPDEEKKKRFSLDFLKKPAVKWSLAGVAALIVLAAICAGALFFLQRSGKLPAFLQPAGVWICGLTGEKPAETQKTAEPQKTAEAPKTAAQTKPLPPPPKRMPPPPKRMPPPPPKTRPEYIASVKNLLSWNRTHPEESKQLLAQVSEKWEFLSHPQTKEEADELAQLAKVCSSADETAFFAPEREKLREAHRAAIQTRQGAVEKAAKEKRLAEEAAKKRAAERDRLAAETKAREQELRREEKERIAKVKQELGALQKEFVEGFFKWAYQGDPAACQTAQQRLDERNLPVDSTKEETALNAKVRSLAKEIPLEVKKMEQFRESLKKISYPDSGFGLPGQKGTYAIIAVSPQTVTLRNQRNRKEESWDLDKPRMRTVFLQIMTRKTKNPHFGFYYDILSKVWRSDKFHQLPKGFWKDHWDVLKPYLTEKK